MSRHLIAQQQKAAKSHPSRCYRWESAAFVKKRCTAKRLKTHFSPDLTPCLHAMPCVWSARFDDHPHQPYLVQLSDSLRRGARVVEWGGLENR